MHSGFSAKHGIPLDHLDYEFVNKCSDVKELEKIIKVLRSKDEGCYPDLERHCEAKLAKLSPNHRLLRKDQPLGPGAQLGSEEWTNLKNDLNTWTDEMSALNLKAGGDSQKSNDGPVRQPTHIGEMNGECENDPPTQSPSKKNPKPRSYREWDKFNIDEELAKIDDKNPPKDVQQETRNSPEFGHILTEGMTEDEKTTRANREKDKGNEAFKSSDFDESVLYYTRSIALQPSIHAFNNRALSYLKLSKWKLALRDCKHVLKEDPNNIKALMRSGSAHKGKGDWKRSMADFNRVLSLEPSNKKAKDLLEEIEEEMTKSKASPPKPQKTKGHRMVIEEVDGDESDSTGANDNTGIHPPTNENAGNIDGTVSSTNGIDGGVNSSNEKAGTDSTNNNVRNADGGILNGDNNQAPDAINSSNEIEEFYDAETGLVEQDSEIGCKESAIGVVDGKNASNGDVGVDQLTENLVEVKLAPKKQNTINPESTKAKIDTNLKVTENIAEMNSKNIELSKIDRVNENINDVINDASVETENDINERLEKSMKIKSDIAEKLQKVSQNPEQTITNQDIPNSDKNSPICDTNPDPISTENVPKVLERPVFYKCVLKPNIAKDKDAGSVLFRSGQYGDAIKKYSQAIDKLEKEQTPDPVNLSTLYTNRATCNYKIGDMASAIGDCTTALEILPHSLKPLLRRAMAYEQRERYPDALRDFRHVQRLDASVELASQGSNRVFGVVKELYPLNWEEKIKHPPTIRSHEIPLIIDQTDADTPIKSPNVPHKIADSISNIDSQQSYVKRTEEHEKINDNDPKTKDTAIHKTTDTIKTKDNVQEKAEVNPAKVLSKDEQFEKWKSEGNELVKKGQYSAAVEYYTKCVNIFPGRVASYTNRALCYLKLNRHTEALEDCTKALVMEPDNVKALFRRAQASKNLYNYKESLSDLTKLLKVDTNNSAAKKEIDDTKALWRNQLEDLKKSSSKKSEPKCAPSAPSRKIEIEEVDEVGDANHISPPAKPATSKPTSKPQKKSPQPTPITTAPVLEKITPYEFMKAWHTLKHVKGTQLHAKLIRQVSPELLPKVLTNNLAGDIMSKIIRCLSDHIMPEGDLDLTYLILFYLSKVQRFNTVTRFLTKHEKLVIEEILGKLRSVQSPVYVNGDIVALKTIFAL